MLSSNASGVPLKLAPPRDSARGPAHPLVRDRATPGLLLVTAPQEASAR